MTIKRRLFLSNLLMYIIPLLLIILVIIIMAMIYSNVYGTAPFQNNHNDPKSFRAPIIILIVLLMAVISTSWFLTRKIIRGILLSLETLSQGVHQLRDGNLSFRIEYQNADEFATVCDDFNEMAERLNEMVDARQKDYQSRKELIAGISHDLRTPLTSIKAYVEGLEKGVASTPEIERKYLTTIRTKTNDLEQIINQLFVFSKMDIGEFPLNMERVEIIEDLREFVNENYKEYRDKGLEINFSEENTSKAFLKIDRTQFHNVLDNILGNSVKYTNKQEAKATISCQKENNNIVIRIIDNGQGVDQNTLDNMFEIFYRADTSRKNSHLGSGIGLAITRKTIERFNGRISAENIEGGGLAIIITIPENMEADNEKNINN